CSIPECFAWHCSWSLDGHDGTGKTPVVARDRAPRSDGDHRARLESIPDCPPQRKPPHVSEGDSPTPGLASLPHAVGFRRMTTGTGPHFPCPFCQSRHVSLLSGGRQFLHYKCTDCSEVWTAQRPAPSAVGRGSDDVRSADRRPPGRGKVSLH